jgi:formate hydrogenlyase subunit 3/multisubunit Na+/H+ antiporter MnhD subunit
MLGFPRPHSDENHASSLSKVIVSLVVMAILFGFGLATLIFRLQAHSSPDAVIPALVLSFSVLCGQFAMVRFLIRHISQAAE